MKLKKYLAFSPSKFKRISKGEIDKARKVSLGNNCLTSKNKNKKTLML